MGARSDVGGVGSKTQKGRITERLVLIEADCMERVRRIGRFFEQRGREGGGEIGNWKLEKGGGGDGDGQWLGYLLAIAAQQ